MSRIKRQIQDDLKEANEILEQFELEVREIPKESKKLARGSFNPSGQMDQLVVHLKFAKND